MSAVADTEFVYGVGDYGHSLIYKSLPIPSPAPDEVLVNIKYSGLCQSSLHTWKSNSKSDTESATIDGHEGAGVVVGIGSEVKDIKVGDHVGVQWMNRTCSSCEACNDGDCLRCPGAEFTGHSVNGTFGEYCTCQEAHAIRIPESYPLDQVVPILCAGLIAYKAVKECGAKPGELVAIAAAGTGLGSLACQYAKVCGYRVLALTNGSQKSRFYTKKIGVDYFIDCDATTDVAGSIKDITGGRPHAAVILEAAEKPLQMALQYVRSRGTVVLVGFPPGDAVKADLSESLQRMINIKTSYGGSKSDTEEAMDIYVREKFHKPSHILDLDRFLTDSDLHKGDLLGHTVLKVPQSPQKSPVSISPALIPSKTDYNVSTHIAKRIEELGVKDYFVVPGDSNLTLLDNLLTNPYLRMVACCNELNTGYAADGYARTSPANVAVVVVPFIVGSLSILNAISGACSERLKVIVISGCPNTTMLAEDKFLHHAPSRSNRDQALHAYEGITAASIRIDNADTATTVIDDAIAKCLDQSAPVFIELANDLAAAPCPTPLPLKRSINPARQQESTRDAVSAITDAWTASRKPILLVGSLVRQYLTRDQVYSLAEKLGCAMLTQPDGRWIGESHPQYSGKFWPGVTDRDGEEIVIDSDLWVVLGGRWSDLHTMKVNHVAERHRMVDIQPDRVDLPNGKTIEHIDVQSLVSALTESNLIPNPTSLPLPDIHIPPFEKELEMSDDPLVIKDIMTGVQRILRPHHTIVADTGETWFAANQIKLPPGADVQMQIAYASIGWGLPASLGCHIARPSGRTIVFMGDGGFQMTVQELSTMIRMKANPIILLFNNLGYKTETAIHEGPYNYIANWDYTQLAKCLSHTPHAPAHNPFATAKDAIDAEDPPMFAEKVQTQADLASALRRAELEDDKLAFIECCIQPGDMTTELKELGSAMGKKFSGDSAIDVEDEPNTNKSLSPGINLPTPKQSIGPDASRLITTLTATPRDVPALDSPEVLSHKLCTDHMVQARWTTDNGWADPEIVPYGPLSLMPTASTLHYATECFEGMKAHRGVDGKLRLFRPILNCRRMLDSASRIALPPFDPEQLLALIKKLCAVDGPKWLPQDKVGSALYIRPNFIGTAPGLGLSAPGEALLYVIMSFWPSASISSTPAAPKKGLRLWSSPDDMVRAWPGGSGSVKVSANYGPSIVAQNEAHKAGFDQVLWLIGPDRHVTEAGASNFFVMWTSPQGKLQLVTAPLEDNTILPGVTRRSILELARERFSDDKQAEALEVVEQKFTIHDIFDAVDEGRLRGAFAVGTACFVTPVVSIYHDGREVNIDPDEVPHVDMLRTWIGDIVSGREESEWAVVVGE